MMSNRRIRTPSWLAICSTLVSGLVLKPTMMPVPATAVSTSDSVMFPTPELRTLTPTFLVAAFSRAWATASADPCTSALTTTFSTFCAFDFDLANRSSRVALPVVAASSLRRWRSSRCTATSLAAFSSSTTLKSSPAVGTPESPSTSTGYPGPTSSTWSPCSFMRARTRP